MSAVHPAIVTELLNRRPVTSPIIGASSRPIVFLIGCGKSKRSEPSPARELYTGALVRKSLELASLVADQTFIVSAAKELLELDELVTPYESTLVGKPRAVRQEWARNVVRALMARTLGGTARPRVVILAGAPYAEPLVDELARRPVFLPAIDLLSGMQIGQRLSFLNHAIALVKGGK